MNADNSEMIELLTGCQDAILAGVFAGKYVEEVAETLRNISECIAKLRRFKELEC